MPSYLPFLLDKWSRSPTIPTITVHARMITVILSKNHLLIHTTAIKPATMATTTINAVILMAITIINAAIFMATAIINDAIFLKKFFILSSLSLFNTAVFFNCKNFVSNLTCHFPTKTKTPAAGITSKRQDFLTKKGISTANPSYVPRKLYFLISCIYYTIFSGIRKFLPDFFQQNKSPEFLQGKMHFQAISGQIF